MKAPGKIIPEEDITVEPETVKKTIDPFIMSLLEAGGQDPKQVKAMYIPPHNGINPYYNEGKHYIGVNPESDRDFDVNLIRKLATGIKTESPDSRITQVLSIYKEKLTTISKDELPGNWQQVTHSAVLRHEEMHKLQNIRFDMWDNIQCNLNVHLYITNKYPSDDEADKDISGMNRVYCKAFSMAEVQALAVGCAYAPGQTEADKRTHEDFVIYWMGKTLPFVEQDHLSGEDLSEEHSSEEYSSALKGFYDQVKNGNYSFNGLKLTANHLSRIIVLSKNPNLYEDIETGQISWEDFSTTVFDSLERVVNDPGQFIKDISNTEFILQTDKLLMEYNEEVVRNTKEMRRKYSLN